MQLRVKNGRNLSSYVSDDTSFHETPIRPRQKPAPIFIPSTTVLSAEMSKGRSMLSAIFSKKLLQVRGAKAYCWVLVTAVVYSFVADDIRMAVLPWESDVYVDLSLVVCIGVFLLDIAARILKSSDYVWSLYFFLDLLAAAAILADIQLLISVLYTPCASGLLKTHKAVGKAARLGASSLQLLSFVRKWGLAKQAVLHTFKTEEASQFLSPGHTAQVLPENSAINVLALPHARLLHEAGKHLHLSNLYGMLK